MYTVHLKVLFANFKIHWSKAKQIFIWGLFCLFALCVGAAAIHKRHLASFAVEFKLIAGCAVLDVEFGLQSWILFQALPNLSTDAVARYHHSLAEGWFSLQSLLDVLHLVLLIKTAREMVCNILISSDNRIGIFGRKIVCENIVRERF